MHPRAALRWPFQDCDLLESAVAVGKTHSRVHHSLLRRPLTIFCVALAVRLGFVAIAHTYRIGPLEDHGYFGWEMGHIARSLATGQGFSNPFMSQTGPTAWVAPLYPLLLAGVFRIFGVFTSASAVVILSLNSVFSALTTLAVFEIGRRCYNLRVAVASAWVWALYPPSFQFASRWVWETPLSTLLLSCAFVLALRIRHTGEPADDRGDVVPKLSRQDSMRWLGFGAVWGLLSLSNPSLLVYLPFCGIWALAGAGWRRWPQAAGAALVCACIMAPWITRNWIVFHRFVPMRGNGGVELYLGNGPMA